MVKVVSILAAMVLLSSGMAEAGTCLLPSIYTDQGKSRVQKKIDAAEIIVRGKIVSIVETSSTNRTFIEKITGVKKPDRHKWLVSVKTIERLKGDMPDRFAFEMYAEPSEMAGMEHDSIFPFKKEADTVENEGKYEIFGRCSIVQMTEILIRKKTQDTGKPSDNNLLKDVRFVLID